MNTDAAALKALFDHAVELDGEVREKWLDALRLAQPDSAAQIERMLTYDAQQTDPFGRSIESLRQSLDFDAKALLGKDFAGFRLQQVLGEGGMGAVFLAERSGQDYQQLVALKLLRGHFVDASAKSHFAQERRILARLHHPNIATLIDAGSDTDGRSFLAMEYIDGVPLLDYCDTAKLDVFARLRLVHGLLSALGYAHRALITHRDLKPDNVLVTPDGTPKLLDFGIARLIETDAATHATAARPFTPEYASPEQMAGEPMGTGSDIYSLGLVLYELCVGVLPWAAGTRARSGSAPTPPATRFRHLDSTRRQHIAAQRGGDIRKITRHLHGDLGRVLERCLQVDPADRYATVEALDRDLAAIVQRQPPPGVHTGRAARAAAFTRRHVWPLALILLVLVASAALLVQTLVSEHRLHAERDRAVASAKKAKVESLKSRRTANFIETTLSAIDPDRAHGMDRSLMRLVLDSAGKRAQRELADEPEVRTAVGRTIARSYNAIGEYALAVQHFDAALAAADQAKAGPVTRANLLTGKARALGNESKRKQADAAIGEALDITGDLPTGSRARLFAQSTHAGFNCDNGHFDACRKAYEHILPIQQRVLGATDADTMESMRGLAFAEVQLAHYERAQTLYKTLISTDRELYGEANSHTLNAINGLAIVYLETKRFAAAEALLTPAVKLATKTFGRNHPLTINMVSNLGGAIRQQPGRNAEARPFYERVLAADKSLYGEDDRHTVFAENNLASLLRDAGQLTDAERHARTAVAHMGRALDPGSTYRGILLDTLASILTREGQFAQAQRTLDKAYAVFGNARGFGPSHPAMQSVIKHYVALYSAWHKPKRATIWRQRLKPPGSTADDTP